VAAGPSCRACGNARTVFAHVAEAGTSYLRSRSIFSNNDAENGENGDCSIFSSFFLLKWLFQIEIEIATRELLLRKYALFRSVIR